MATVQQRIEVWTGELWDTAPVYQVLQDSVRDVIADLNADALTPLWVELTDSGSGVTTTAYRVLEARKGLYKATPITPSFRTSERITETSPVTYTMGGKTYVLPSGGTVLALAYPTVKLSDTSVTNVPEQLMTLFVLRTAEGTLHHLMHQLTLGLSETLTLPTPPGAPVPPTISASDAVAVAPQAVAVGGLPTPPSYSAPTLASRLASASWVLGIGDIAVPSAPDAPSIAFTDAVAAVVGDVTIDPLPPVPSFNAPVWAGNLSLPTLPTPDFSKGVDNVDIDPPTAPSAPSIVSVDPIGATVLATTLGSLGTAPTFTRPTFEGLLAVPTVAAIDVTKEVDGVTSNDPPAALVAPQIAHIDAQAATVVATSVAALGTAPSYVRPVFGGSAAIPALPTPAYVNGLHGAALVVPSAPSAPSIDYLPAPIASFGSAAAIASLPTPPSMSEAVFEGAIAAVSSAIPALVDLETKLDDSTANIPPTPPSAPAFLSPGISDVSISMSGVSAPAFVAPSISLSYSNWSTYLTNEDPEIMREALNKVALELQEVQTKIDSAGRDWANQVEVYRAQVQKAIEQARIDLGERQAELSERNRAEIEQYAASIRRFEAQVAEYQSYVNTKLAQFNAALQRATTGIAEAQRLFVQKYEVDVQKNVAAYQGAIQDHLRECDRILQQGTLDQERLVTMFRTETDVNVQNAIQRAQTDLAEYSQALARYREQVSHLQMDIAMIHQKWDMDFRKAVEPWVASQRIALEQYATDIQNERTKFEVDMAQYRASSERSIEQARLTLQEALANARTSSDVSVANRAASLQAAIRDWEADVETWNAGLARYERELQRVVQKWEADFRRVVEPWSIEQANRVAKYRTDLDAEIAAFNKEVVAYQADAQHKIEQARTTLQEALANARTSTEVSMQARAAQLQAAIRDWEADVEEFNAGLARYDREIQRSIEEWRAAYQKAYEPWAQQQSLYLQQYQAELSAEQVRYGGVMQDHMREVDRILEQARSDAQRLAQQAQLTTDVAVQNGAQTLSAAIADWSASLDRFRAQVQLYQAQVEARISQFTASSGTDLRIFEVGSQIDVARYSGEVASARAALDADLARHRAEMDHLQLVAQMFRQEAEQTAALSTEVALRNKAQELSAAVASWEAALGAFRAGIESYVSQVRSAIDARQSDQAVREAKLAMFARSRDRVRQMYNEAKDRFERAFTRYRPINVALREF